MIKTMRIYKLCPLWKRHQSMVWNFVKIEKFHWWCSRCPLKLFDGIGKAYRDAAKAALGREEEKTWNIHSDS